MYERFIESPGPHQKVLISRGLMLHLFVQAVQATREILARGINCSLKDWLSEDAFEIVLENGRKARVSRKSEKISIVFSGLSSRHLVPDYVAGLDAGETVEESAVRWMGVIVAELTRVAF